MLRWVYMQIHLEVNLQHQALKLVMRQYWAILRNARCMTRHKVSIKNFSLNFNCSKKKKSLITLRGNGKKNLVLVTFILSSTKFHRAKRLDVSAARIRQLFPVEVQLFLSCTYFFKRGSENNLHIYLWLPLHFAAALHHSASLEDQCRVHGCLSFRTEARLYVALIIRPPHETRQL